MAASGAAVVPPPVSQKPGAERRRKWLPALTALGVSVVAGFLLFWNLGSASLLGDEAIYAEVAREAAVEGHWLPLTFRGSPFRHKPPAKLWADALLFRLFGVGELPARLLSAASGIATAALLFRLGGRLAGPACGALAALLFVSRPHLLSANGLREGALDAFLLFLLTAGVSLVLPSRTRDGPTLTRRRFWGATALLALGMWVKPPFPLVAAPLLAGGSTPGWRHPREIWRWLAPAAQASLICLTAFALWFGAMAGAFGMRFLKVMRREFLVRLGGAIDPAHLQGPLFYGVQIARDFGAWLLVLPLLFLGGRGGRAADRRTILFLLAWALLVLLPFSLPASKLPWYVFPAYPPLSLLVAWGAVQGVDLLAGFRRAAAAGVALLIVVGLILSLASAFRQVTAPPRRLELHRFLEHLQKLPQVEVLADRGLLERPLALRAWNYFYLAQIPQLRWIPPQSLTLEPGTCRFLVTDRAPAFLEASALAPAEILPVTRYDWREAEIQVIDLCGSGLGRLRK